MKYFEDFVVGGYLEFGGTYPVTEQEIREIGERWDPQPFHINPVAAVDSVFGGLVASSVHLFAILTLLCVDHEPVAAVSSLGFRSVHNHAPVRAGDVLRAGSTTVEARRSRSRPGLGVVTARCELLNQRLEAVFSYENAALIQCRPDPSR